MTLFYQIWYSHCSWYSKCTDFQKIYYSRVQSLSDALKLGFWILEALHHICSRKLLMKTTNFFDLRLSDFLSRLFNVNMKLQQQKRMLNAFQGLSKLQKKTSGKNKRCSTVLTCSRIDRNLLFFYFLCSNL